MPNPLEQTLIFGAGGNAGEATVLGWSTPEDGFTWTIGRRAVLCLALAPPPLGFELTMSWSAYLPPGLPAQRVAIRVGGRALAEHLARGLETACFQCPPPARHEQRLLIEFDLPDAAQPSVVAGHHDDRMLALCLRWLRVTPRAAPRAEPPPPAQPVLSIAAEGDDPVAQHRRGWPSARRPGTPARPGAQTLDILFGSDGNAGDVTRDGWSVPEPGYLWTNGGRSRLVLPPPAPAEAWELEAEVQPFVDGARLSGQRLAVSVNGVPAGSVRLRDQAVVKLDLPSERLAGAEALELVFDQPDAARPRDVVGGRDGRALGFSFKRLRLNPVSPALAPPAAREAPPRDGPLDQLMLGFESLGENCEFGLVQRACGAEPLGLLRFASAPLPTLLAALLARFEGLGAARNIAVEVSANGREYMVRDHAFGFYYHAWVRVGEKTPGEIAEREARRVPFLARKLAEDLASGDKIMVYHGMRPLALTHAQALARAVRLYGKPVLLWVELADAAHPPGAVEWIAEGLMKGYIDRFAPGEDAHDFALDSWIALCRRAAGLRDGGAT